MLTPPAPHKRNLFRTAYSPRYLGYMLVEGQDRHRDNPVFPQDAQRLEAWIISRIAWELYMLLSALEKCCTG